MAVEWSDLTLLPSLLYVLLHLAAWLHLLLDKDSCCNFSSWEMVLFSTLLSEHLPRIPLDLDVLWSVYLGFSFFSMRTPLCGGKS